MAKRRTSGKATGGKTCPCVKGTSAPVTSVCQELTNAIAKQDALIAALVTLQGAATGVRVDLMAVRATLRMIGVKEKCWTATA